MKLESYRAYLTATKIPLRLACTDRAGWPSIVSLWYLYQDGALYCATQADAKITTYLSQHPRCGYEIAGDEPPYCGIRGRASATILPAKGETILLQLLDRYVGGTDNALAKALLARRDSEVALRLVPESVHSWNYSDRMRTSVSTPLDGLKPCP